MFQPQAKREDVARRIYYISGGLSNVGAIARLVPTEEFRRLKPLFGCGPPGRFRDASSCGPSVSWRRFSWYTVWWERFVGIPRRSVAAAGGGLRSRAPAWR